jgi:PEP-CTERM motif
LEVSVQLTRSPELFFLPSSLKSQIFIEEHLKDSSSSVVRQRHPKRSRASASTRFLVVLLFAATAAITWQFARQQPVSSMPYSAAKPSPVHLNKTDAPDSSQDYASFIALRPSRPSYLYSVVSGGIASAEELRQAMDRDPIVAHEFAGFDFQRAHLVQVSEKQSMHVAYRVGDKVYWTRKKVALHPGETLISDGKIVARTRCGNRIAMAPLGPPALMDPVSADFDQPIFSNDMVTHEVEAQPETYADALPVVPPVGANALQPMKGKRILPFFILPFFGLPGGGSSHTPLAVAPEPGTLLLLSTGLVGVVWKVRKSRRKR